MTEQRILGVNEVVFDERFYPRERTNWITSYKYKEAIKTGSKFPPITVAEFEGKYILVDGWHRLDATKQLKQKHIQAEILRGLTEKEIMIEAIKRNVNHGLPLSANEVTRAILKLKDMKVSMIDISKILHITPTRINPFVSKRISYTATGNPVVLKRPIQHLKDTVFNKSLSQEDIGGQSQVFILHSLKSMIEKNWIDLKNKEVEGLIIDVYELLANLIKTKSIKREKPVKKKRGRPVKKKRGRPKKKSKRRRK